ncbi:DUF1294 domain-containing protein [Devosia sp. SD17-2]|uniref:DUF1294 domain-containing protein n=1 Tax=Devosia sp. SD17-2 TaxID=2976459 RepID=UPI0023D8875E|nr:DUF1294 domain-containing protein [Devosia sp. SD17-2]WEJ33376.1 DUF1294 domain-containing protein [Devosia sp. SD17-2]
MALLGTVVEWNDERGFGFIAADDGERYFVHISEVGRRKRRPALGDRVDFVPKKGSDGRIQAASVRLSGATKPIVRPARPMAAPRPQALSEWRLPLAAAFVGLITIGWLLGPVPLWLLAAYGMMALVTFISYWVDKRAAEAGKWRTSEATLHGFDLAFGIVGGLAGQILLRHKTRKSGFAGITAAIALLHLAFLLAVMLGWIDIAPIANALGLA